MVIHCCQVKQQKKMAVRKYRQLEEQYGEISAKIQKGDRDKQDIRRIHQVPFQTMIVVGPKIFTFSPLYADFTNSAPLSNLCACATKISSFRLKHAS